VRLFGHPDALLTDCRHAFSMYNRGQAYVTRSLVLENASWIRKNYEAAFNQNTDDLFRNRTTLG